MKTILILLVAMLLQADDISIYEDFFQDQTQVEDTAQIQDTFAADNLQFTQDISNAQQQSDSMWQQEAAETDMFFKWAE
jgi:hypothetical protein